MVDIYQIINRLKDIKGIKGNRNVRVSGITYDSRRVNRNYLFVAIKGLVHDGHDFMEEAVSKGAAAIICENFNENLPHTVCQIAVTDSRKALAYASKAFYDNVSERLKLIGVTGTNGKTTTTYLIKKILENSGCKVGLIGTISVKIGDRDIPTERTTPEASDLHHLFYQMYQEGVEYVVMEVSSHSLEFHRVKGCSFEAGIFTNISQDHLDFHKNLSDYYEAKKKLFLQSKKAIINKDDFYGGKLIEELAIPVFTYGIGKDADVIARDIEISSKGVEFTVKTGNEAAEMFLKIPGKFSVYNALAATTACLALGIDLSTIKNGLLQVEGVPGRFELIDEGQGFAVIVDYAHTPDGLQNILNTVKEFASGKIITVFGCGGDRDKNKRPKMGRIAAELSDLCIITSDNPRSEDPKGIIREIEEGVKPVTKNYVKIVDRRDAIGYAINTAQAKDIVIIAGKGHETYQVMGDKMIPFDDREIAREMIRRRLKC